MVDVWDKSMIHHFLTDSEKTHFNDLHKVNFCIDCKHINGIKCDIKKMITYGNIACDDYQTRLTLVGKKPKN